MKIGIKCNDDSSVFTPLLQDVRILRRGVAYVADMNCVYSGLA